MQVLKHRLGIIERAPFSRESCDSIGSTGILSAEGKEWMRERRILSAALCHKQVSNYVPTMKRLNSRLLEKWEKECKSEGSTVVIDTDLENLLGNAIMELAFGLGFDFI